MTALAAKLGLLSLFLTDLAAVLPPLAAFGDRARAGGVGALLKGFSQETPPLRSMLRRGSAMRSADLNSAAGVLEVVGGLLRGGDRLDRDFLRLRVNRASDDDAPAGEFRRSLLIAQRPRHFAVEQQPGGAV